MKSDTKTITVERDYETVYEFVANPENLPIWAKGFARSIQRAGEAWIIETPHGEQLNIRYITGVTRCRMPAGLKPSATATKPASAG
jgi:hypothetical protein